MQTWKSTKFGFKIQMQNNQRTLAGVRALEEAEAVMRREPGMGPLMGKYFRKKPTKIKLKKVEGMRSYRTSCHGFVEKQRATLKLLCVLYCLAQKSGEGSGRVETVEGFMENGHESLP